MATTVPAGYYSGFGDRTAAILYAAGVPKGSRPGSGGAILGPDGTQIGTVNNGKFSPAAGFTPSPTAPGGTPAQPPSALPSTNAGIPGLPGPTPAPQPIIEPGYTGPDSRFGSYNLDPYVVGQGYAPGGVPTQGAPAPQPTPSPTPSPAPGGAPGGVPTGTGGSSNGLQAGSGPGGVGNAGGAAANAGAAGDFAGHPGGDGGNSGFGGIGGSSTDTGGAPAPGGTPSPWDYGLIDIGPVGSNLLSAAATAAPGWIGAGLGGLQLAGRAYNTATADSIRQQQGVAPLDLGQWAGALTGWNGYGDLGGNTTIANPDQLGTRLGQVPAYNMANDVFGQFGAPAETASGNAYQPGPGGILGAIGGWLGLTDQPSRSLDIGAVNNLTHPDYSDATGWATDPAAATSPAPTKSAAKIAADAFASAQNHANSGGYANSNGSGSGGYGSSNASGTGYGNTGAASGYGGNDSTGVGSSGQLGHIAIGGFIPGNAALEGDNHLMATTPGEFVINRHSARMLGPHVLNAMNDPRMAFHFRNLLEQHFTGGRR